MRVTSDNYGPLSAFCGWMFNNVVPLPPDLPAEAHPMNVLRAFEAKSPSLARKGLAMAICDMIARCNDMSRSDIAIIDGALTAEGLPTLTSVKIDFSKKVSGALSRGRIRSEGEYHTLRSVADGLTGEQQKRAWAILDAFQMRDTQ